MAALACQGVSAVSPPTTRSSSRTSSAAIRSASEPSTHSTLAPSSVANRSTSSTSTPPGRPPSRVVQGSLAVIPARSVPPRTRSSVLSGSRGIPHPAASTASSATAARSGPARRLLRVWFIAAPCRCMLDLLARQTCSVDGLLRAGRWP